MEELKDKFENLMSKVDTMVDEVKVLGKNFEERTNYGEKFLISWIDDFDLDAIKRENIETIVNGKGKFNIMCYLDKDTPKIMYGDKIIYNLDQFKTFYYVYQFDYDKSIDANVSFLKSYLYNDMLYTINLKIKDVSGVPKLITSSKTMNFKDVKFFSKSENSYIEPKVIRTNTNETYHISIRDHKYLELFL